MNIYIQTKKFYRILRQFYRNIGATKRGLIHRFFIFYFDKFIYPRLDNFNFSENLLFFTLPKYYGNEFKDSAVGIYQIVDPLKRYLKENNSNLVIYLWHPEENSNLFALLKFFRQVHNLGPKKIIIDSPQYNSIKFKDFGIEVYQYLQKKYDIGLIELGWDTISEKWWNDILLIDLDRTVLILDNPLKNFVPKLLRESGKAVSVVPPFDLTQTVQVNNHRNIYYNFIGSVESYRNYREEYLEFISDLGYQNLISGFDSRKGQLERKDYLEILSTSKISINFSMTHSANFQLKGRVWESMIAGSMLLEQDNEQIKYFFKAGIHYATFSDKFQLKDKLLHYINHDSERIKIAQAGQKRVIELINSGELFEYIINYNEK
jgi:hypothetical protein